MVFQLSWGSFKNIEDGGYDIKTSSRPIGDNSLGYAGKFDKKRCRSSSLWIRSFGTMVADVTQCATKNSAPCLSVLSSGAATAELNAMMIPAVPYARFLHTF